MSATATPRAGSPQTMPSRRFLIEQSILTAAHDAFPFAVGIYGIRGWLRDATNGGERFVATIAIRFHAAILIEFEKLVSRYSENGAGE